MCFAFLHIMRGIHFAFAMNGAHERKKVHVAHSLTVVVLWNSTCAYQENDTIISTVLFCTRKIIYVKEWWGPQERKVGWGPGAPPPVSARALRH